MKISLFQGILLGVLCLAALIGIFIFATYNGNSKGGTTTGKVVIWGTLPKKDMQNALIEEGKIDASFKAVSYVEKDPATLPSDLSTAIATGVGPDLVIASQEELHALTKFISPVPSSVLSAATFENAFVGEGSILTAPSGYYGLPFLVDPLMLFSNRAVLSSDGITRPPQTWEALTGLVPNVLTQSPSRDIARGLAALGSYNNVHNARGILSTLFIQTGVPISSYSANGLLAADLGVSGSNGTPTGNSVINFYTQFVDPAKISYTWNASLPDSQQAFLAGDLALYLGYASEARFLAAANPNLDIGASPVPQPATASVKNVYGLLYSLMIPVGAKNASGAYQVAVLLTNAAEQAAAAEATGLAPATLTALSSAPSDQASAVAYTEALYAKGWLSPMPDDTDSVFSSMITSVLSGRSLPTTALTTAVLSLDALLQK